MSKMLANVLALLLLVIALITGWLILDSLQKAFSPVQSPVSGLATQAQVIFNPTPTIYPDSITVVRQIQSLARLETAQYTLEKVIRAETGQGPLGGLFGDRLLFVAHGNVIAGVDLARLQPGDVVAQPDGQVTIILPAAEVFVVTLDNQKSYVYDRETGLLTQGDANLETLARRAAEDELRKGALEDGILNLAQNNAGAFVERLLYSLRFTRVTIITATPRP